eukprot:g76732.t1
MLRARVMAELLWMLMLLSSHTVASVPTLAECTGSGTGIQVVHVSSLGQSGPGNWSATFGQYLSVFLSTQGCPIPTTYLENDVVSANASIVFVPPQMTGVVQTAHPGSTLLATCRRNLHGIITQEVGGVLVRRQSSNQGLVSWEDLVPNKMPQNLKLCGIAPDSFLGFQVQSLEALRRTNSSLEALFNIIWAGSAEQ